MTHHGNVTKINGFGGNTMKSIANNLRTLRGKKSRALVQRESGINVSTLMDIEAGRDFRVSTLMQLAHYYDTHPARIFSGALEEYRRERTTSTV